MHRSLAVLLMMAPAAAGQDADSPPTPEVFAKQQHERFALYHACFPILHGIVGPDRDGAAIGLTSAALRAVVDRRLRAARLDLGRIAFREFLSRDYVKQPRAGLPTLTVRADVAGPAFHVSVEFRKNVTDAFEAASSAATWSRGTTGAHGGDADAVLSAAGRRLDQFLDAYLRVNEAACVGRGL